MCAASIFDREAELFPKNGLRILEDPNSLVSSSLTFSIETPYKFFGNKNGEETPLRLDNVGVM
jgi:hypothetical protein